MTAGKSVAGLVVSLAVVFLAPAIGGIFSARAVPGWYASLSRPSWTPPNWVFAPVWTALYVLMALSAWLVWKQEGFAGAKTALWLFAVQLALNAAWTPIFFGLHRPGLAFAEIAALWCAIVATVTAFWQVRTLAGVLMLPYLLWASFAAALNFAIWRLNS